MSSKTSTTATAPKRSTSKPREAPKPDHHAPAGAAASTPASTSTAVAPRQIAPPARDEEWAADDLDDSDVPAHILEALRDPTWQAADLKDMRSNVVMTAEVEAAIAAYEEEAQQWRVEREAGRRYRAAAHHDPARGNVEASGAATESLPYNDTRSKTLNNPKGKVTFDTIVAACLNPEVRALGADAIAESLLQVKNVKLDSVGLTDTDSLECLGRVHTLDLSNNFIRNIDGLEILMHLRVLIMPDNFIESLLPIAALELELLDVRRNRISRITDDDGTGLLPLTLKRLFLEGNPCCTASPDLATTVLECCSELEVLDDETFDRTNEDDDGADGDEQNDNADGDEAEEAAMDFDVDEEEARTAAFLAQQRAARGGHDRPGSARYSLPVSEGVVSSVRTATDDLLRRYENELQGKLQSILRANTHAIAALQLAASGDADSRPSSRYGRESQASSRQAPSTLAAAVAARHDATGAGSLEEPRSSGLVDSPRREAAMPPTEDGGSDGASSESSFDAEEDMETGLAHGASASRPHAQAASRQTDLQRELRFAMEHQRNVAINELNDRWDDGVDRLRQLRDRQEAKHRSDELREATAPTAGAAYSRALEFLKGYCGERNLDKYRRAPAPKPAPPSAPAPAQAQAQAQ